MARRVAWGAGGGKRRLVLVAGLLLLPVVTSAQSQKARPAGRGFFYGGAIGGGRLSFPGGGGRALALSAVVGEKPVPGTSSAVGVRDATVVAAGEDAPGAERIVPLPAHEGAGGFSMHAGYAFNRRVAVLMDLGICGGLSSADFNHAVGALLVRFRPTSRLWLEAGPALGDLGYGSDNTVVRSGAITGTGLQGTAGVSVVRRAKWSLDIKAGFSSIGYDGFRVETATLGIGASTLPL